MEQRQNRRGIKGNYVKGQHLKLEDLKVIVRDTHMYRKYLSNENIPVYPRPEFHVSHLKHDTDGAGLEGIVRDGGFRDPYGSPPKRLWWSLAVKAEDVAAAETRLLEETFPNRTEDQAQQQKPFLEKFTTSPAFSEMSMLGSFRFTLPLETVLKAYSEQFCSGAQPVMRVFEMQLYKQEVMHAVLVHSPDDQEQFAEFPPLTDDPHAVCVYRDGRFLWRPEAMCETHNHELIQKRDENLLEAGEAYPLLRFYVWDHVGIALHMEGEKVLQFDQLRENLTFCEKAPATLSEEIIFQTFEDAEALVQDLWPDSGPLKRETPLTSSADVDEHEPSD